MATAKANSKTNSKVTRPAKPKAKASAKQKSKQKDRKINMHQLFLDHQKHLCSGLSMIRSNVDHEGMKGDGAETIWIKFLDMHLPIRYKVDSAKIVDHLGNTSDQIDVVIYDRQYTPFVFNHAGIMYIPAESVYAVFEAKQSINKSLLEYAMKKVKSVRQLNRTSAAIIDRGIVKPAAPLFRILGGFLSLDNGWQGTVSNSAPFANIMKGASEDQLIDIGCIMADKSFAAQIDASDALNPKVEITYSDKEETLIYFFLKLVAELQKLGTVRAIDLNQYMSTLKTK